MTAEIICVGTEILLGDIVNTDAQYLARELSLLGINVYYQDVVGDNPERLLGTLKTALGRADLIITTGGLGPTYDDLTKETIAASVGKKLALNQESYDRLVAAFRHFGREMTENNVKQAYLPEGCIPMQNDHGTAPGCIIETEDGKCVMMFPGPPSELKPMFVSSARPYLEKRSGLTIVSKNIRIFGLGESEVEFKLRDLMKTAQNPTVAPYAKTGEVTLRVTARGENEAVCLALIEPMIGKIRAVIGEDVIYSTEHGNLQQALVALLTEKGLKVCTAESCTGGLVAKRITDVPGSSAVFEVGLVSYANEVKSQFLGVPEQTLASVGAVSAETAYAMTEGALHISGADVAVSITGVAGPGGGSEEKPVGTVYVCVGDSHLRWVKRLAIRGRGERETIRYLASSHALNMLIRFVRNRYPDKAAKSDRTNKA